MEKAADVNLSKHKERCCVTKARVRAQRVRPWDRIPVGDAVPVSDSTESCPTSWAVDAAANSHGRAQAGSAFAFFF